MQKYQYLLARVIVPPVHLILKVAWLIEHKCHSQKERTNSFVSPIPKIFHQIWIKGKLPTQFKNNATEWKVKNPEWKYMLWSERKVKKEFELPSFYNDLLSDSAKSDIIRYLIIKKYGGVYIDTDFVCYKNISPLLKSLEFVGSLECWNRIGSSFFASVPNHPLLQNIVSSYEVRYKKYHIQYQKGDIGDDILFGPKFLTEHIKTYFKLKSPKGCEILSRKFLFPTAWVEDHVGIKKVTPKKYPLAYGAHRWKFSWK